MQVIITHGTLARSRVLHFNRLQLAASVAMLTLAILLVAATLYHLLLLKAAREGWPLSSQLVRLVVRDGFAQRDRFMRENLDAMAQRVGEMQAKLVKLEAMSERVSGMAGVKPEELKPVAARHGCRRRPGRPVRAAATAVARRSCTSSSTRSTSDRPAHRPVHADRVAPVRGAPDSADGPQQPAGRRPGRLRLRLPHRPVHRPHRRCTPGSISRPRSARRSIAAAGGVVLSAESTGLRQHGRDRPWQRPGHALCAHASKSSSSAGDLVRRGQTRRRGRQHRPLDRAAPALRGAGRRRAAEPGQVPRGARRARSWRKAVHRAATLRPELGASVGSSLDRV